MIIAFLLGGAMAFFPVMKHDVLKTGRTFLYRLVVFYLLIKIGFNGGKALVGQPWGELLSVAFLVVGLSVVWTVGVLYLLQQWSGFDRLTGLSIATHFGSVSVGTFVAGIAFIEAMGYSITAPVAVWLALMELPALIVGMIVLRLKFREAFKLLFQDITLLLLFGAIVIGYFFDRLIPIEITTFAFTTIFTPILFYFLFEMGTKAQASLPTIQKDWKPLVFWGLFLPLLGSLLGLLAGHFYGLATGEHFILMILMASASYVLVPITLPEILKSVHKYTKNEAEKAVSTGLALSVSVTLPFNIIVGFELYYWWLTLFFAG